MVYYVFCVSVFSYCCCFLLQCNDIFLNGLRSGFSTLYVNPRNFILLFVGNVQILYEETNPVISTCPDRDIGN